MLIKNRVDNVNQAEIKIIPYPPPRLIGYILLFLDLKRK